MNVSGSFARWTLKPGVPKHLQISTIPGQLVQIDQVDVFNSYRVELKTQVLNPKIL